MRFSLSTRTAGFGLLLAAILASGCGKDSVAVVPVRGKVTVDGQPVTSGQVSFIPTSADQKGGMSAGQIEGSGDYKIFTGGKEGAPSGKYKVTVTPSMVPTGGKSMPSTPFNAKYSDVKTTPLTIDVPSGSYDLKLTK